MDLNSPEASQAKPRRSARTRRPPQRQIDSGIRPSQSAARSRLESIRVLHTRAIMEHGQGTFSGDSSEVAADNDLCPICQLLFFRPVITTCGHTLCESCMTTWANVSVLNQLQLVDVDEPVVANDPVCDLEARCPMCRTQTSARLDPARADNLRALYPKTYGERELAENGKPVDGNDDGIQTVTLGIGNRHQLVTPKEGSENMHDWTFFIRPSRTDIIEEVHVLLHPTFRPPRIIHQRPPYEIRRLGWGHFNIVAYVILKAGYSWISDEAQDSPDGAEKGMLGLQWLLDFNRFNGRGSMNRLKLKVKNQRDWAHIGDEAVQDERSRRRLIRQYQRDGRYPSDDEAD